MVERKSVLTIAIPTYNRNEKLKRSIEVLVPQLNSKVKILILDNESTTPVAETLAEILNKLNAESAVTIVRNKANVGMAANIIRCFETCDTEWMWLLGDDDVPNLVAVAGVLEDIEKHKDCSFLNYKSPLCPTRKADFYTTGQEQLLDQLDGFGNLLFISVGVYNLKSLSGDLRITYQLAYSIAPHLVYLLSGLKATGKAWFLTRELHDFHLRDTTEAENWSWLSLSLCIPVLYEVPLLVSENAKRKFAGYILTHVKSPKEIFSILEQPKHYDMITYQKRFLMRQIYFRSLLFNGLDSKFFSFLYYDFKLYIKNILLKRNSNVLTTGDERI